MALGQRLEIRQGQSLVMTPQLQQAIKLLQLSNIELAEYCESELEKNPLLERDESAPREDERVVLWLQNSHAVPIPAGAVSLDRMGAEAPVTLDRAVGPFATVALDVGAMLPAVRWPAQVEVRAGRHVVRPRYEVTRAGRTRIAHVNVERADLRPDAAIPELPAGTPQAVISAFAVK